MQVLQRGVIDGFARSRNAALDQVHGTVADEGAQFGHGQRLAVNQTPTRGLWRHAGLARCPQGCRPGQISGLRGAFWSGSVIPAKTGICCELDMDSGSRRNDG